MRYYYYFRQRFKYLKIRDKLILSYLCLIILPAILLSVISYQRSSYAMEQQVIHSTKQAFDQAGTFILYKMTNIKDISSMLYMNKEVRKILNKTYSKDSISEQIDDYNRLMDIIQSAQNSREIYKIRFFLRSESLYSNQGATFTRIDEIVNTEWYKEVSNAHGGIYWRPTYNYIGANGETQRIISCVRTIGNGGVSDEVIGMVSIDVSEDSMYQIINQTNITNHGETFLVDKGGNIITSKDKTKIGQNISEKEYFHVIKDKDEGYTKLKIDRDSFLVCYKKLENTDWQLIALIPLEEIVFPTKKILKLLILLMGLEMIMTITVAYSLSNGINKRIKQLVCNMREVETDNWDVHIPIDSFDEIGILQEHFNSMIQNIRHLIKEKYEVEIEKKSAELKALQAQINPHFLYNTLDMIHWMALSYQAEDISYIVGNLAKFFRLSLSGGKDVVSIQDEIEHMKIYIEIQNKRFSNRIHSVLDIDEKILHYKTLKLILQPIIENAIIHGINEKQSKEGCVKIKGNIENKLVVFTVEDDGVGMSKEKIKAILSNHMGVGYGIKNVNERIKLYFGDQYGLEYFSEEGCGTKVIIRFPLVSE